MENTIFQQKGRFINVGRAERIVSAISGGVLLGFGIIRPGWQRVINIMVGSYLLYRGATGHSVIYRWLNINRTESGGGVVQVERSVTIMQPIETVYSFWRSLENLPRFMQHLVAVTETGNRHSHWTVTAPLGKTVEWDSEIITDIPNQELRWQSLPGSQIENQGSVRFKTAPGQRGTEVLVQLRYAPPGGSAGAAVAKIMGQEPDVQIREDLRRLKALLETGEILTIEGQPSGRSGLANPVRTKMETDR